MTLGQRLKKAREDQSLKQDDLAEKAGVTQATISRIETGAMERPSVDVVQKLARALGLSMDRLLDDDISADSAARAASQSPTPTRAA